MKKDSYHMLGHTLIRVVVGIMFVLTGLAKLMNPDIPINLLSGIGFFSMAPVFWAWVLLLSELVFGVLVFVGYKVKYTAWPLALVLVVAALTVGLPSQWNQSSGFFLHLTGAAACITIALTGPGKYAITKD